MYLVDALEIADLSPLGELLVDSAVTKVIHNAAFERAVLAQYGIGIASAVDTLELSRSARGRDAPGGHSLAAVCRRELGRELDKAEQTSDWRRRPLTESQLAYAALDAEVLLPIRDRLRAAIQRE